MPSTRSGRLQKQPKANPSVDETALPRKGTRQAPRAIQRVTSPQNLTQPTTTQSQTSQISKELAKKRRMANPACETEAASNPSSHPQNVNLTQVQQEGKASAPDENLAIQQLPIHNDDEEDSHLIDATDDALPTLSNFLDPTTLRRWPQSRCKEALAKMRPTANKLISDAVRTEILSAFQRWEHTKLMICLSSNITLRMLNKEIGLVAPNRKPSDYVNYLKFSKTNLSESMPQPNRDDPEAVHKLAERNKWVGNAWNVLTIDEKLVFSNRLLLALAGIPDLASEPEVEDGEEESHGDKVVAMPEVTKLSADEESRYRPLYERLVAHDIVVSKLGTSVAGISDKKFTRRSLQVIQKINQDLNVECHRQQFEYWLVAASTVPPLKAGSTGWCKVFTSMPVMSKYVTSKANFPTIFAAVAQGTSIIKAVSECAGANQIPPPPMNATDKVKKRCRGILLDLLINVVGKKPRQGFPQGENPQAIFIQRGIPARLELDEGSKLSETELKLGFLKMNAEGRRKWMKDVEDGKFRFVYDDSKLEQSRGTSEFHHAKRVRQANPNTSDDSDEESHLHQKVVHLDSDSDESEGNSASDQSEPPRGPQSRANNHRHPRTSQRFSSPPSSGSDSPNPSSQTSASQATEEGPHSKNRSPRESFHEDSDMDPNLILNE